MKNLKNEIDTNMYNATTSSVVNQMKINQVYRELFDIVDVLLDEAIILELKNILDD